MTALTTDRNTRFRTRAQFSDPMAAGVTIFEGALVCLDASGNAVPGTTATGLKARGVADRRADNTDGAAGDKTVPTSCGCYRFENSDADPIARADICADAYIVDDQTVAKTDGTGTRSVAGQIVDLDASGVWVQIG